MNLDTTSQKYARKTGKDGRIDLRQHVERLMMMMTVTMLLDTGYTQSYERKVPNKTERP